VICLETTFLVDYFREDPENPGPAGQYLADDDTESFALSAVSLHEVLYGSALTATDPVADTKQRRVDLDFADVLPFNAEIAAVAASIRVDLRSAGNEIPVNDAYIAATARYHEYPLVCADEHFERVPNLDTVRYK